MAGATSVESASIGSTPVIVTDVTGSSAKMNACTTKISGSGAMNSRSDSHAASVMESSDRVSSGSAVRRLMMQSCMVILLSAGRHEDRCSV